MVLWRIRATVDDRPGYLSVLTASLALRSVNILTVQVHTTETGAVDDFLVDAPGTLTRADLLAAVERGRGRDAWVVRADPEGLADQPTRALALAARPVRDPETLGDTLAALLDADGAIWRPAPVPKRTGFTATTMRLPDPGGGAYELTRTEPPFTPAEYARAQALVEVAAAAVHQTTGRVTLLLSDGREVVLRPATAGDLPAVADMHARCSPASRHRRYLTGSRGPTGARLRRLLDPAGGVTLVALDTDGVPGEPARVVAMASLLAEGDLAEVALLVEDSWQRRGVGTALLRRLAAYATRAGIAALVAHAHADNPAVPRTLARLGRCGAPERDGALVTVTLPLAAPSRSLPVTG